MSKAGGFEKIAVDTNFLVALVDDALNDDDRARLDELVAQVDKVKGQIVIPMPALAEFLAGAEQAGLEYLDRLERKAYIEVAPFDRKAATECALLEAAAYGRATHAASNGKSAAAAKKDGVNGTRQKVKVDRQIVAIAKACGARVIISADDGVRAAALRAGVKHMTIQDLPLPDTVRQHKLPLETRQPS